MNSAPNYDASGGIGTITSVLSGRELCKNPVVCAGFEVPSRPKRIGSCDWGRIRCLYG